MCEEVALAESAGENNMRVLLDSLTGLAEASERVETAEVARDRRGWEDGERE